ESVSGITGVVVGREYSLATGKCGYQHDQAGLRFVEVREHGIDDVKRVAGLDEQLRFVGKRGDVAAGRGCAFQAAHDSSADGDDTAATLLRGCHLRAQFRTDDDALRVQPLRGYVAVTQALIGAGADVQRDIAGFDAARG